MKPLLDHLKQRWFHPQRYSGVWLDHTTPSVTVSLWNLSGELTGYQTYQPHQPKLKNNNRSGRYFTWHTPGKLAVWGLETIQPWHSQLFVTEGIFESARLHHAGFASIAVLGNNPRMLTQWFSLLPWQIITVIQADAAGQRLIKYGHQHIFTKDRDLDELSNSEFCEVLSKVVLK